jgi:hypothetical protein
MKINTITFNFQNQFLLLSFICMTPFHYLEDEENLIDVIDAIKKILLNWSLKKVQKLTRYIIVMLIIRIKNEWHSLEESLGWAKITIEELV